MKKKTLIVVRTASGSFELFKNSKIEQKYFIPKHTATKKNTKKNKTVKL